jgi:immune inhibitor A
MLLPGLVLLPFLWLTTPAQAEFRCAGSHSLASPPASVVAAKPARLAQSSTTGTRRALVLFARFKGDPANPMPAWVGELFNPGLPGSVAHFYDTMSFGKLQLRGEVAPKVYESPQPASAYLSADPSEQGQFGEFAQEILQQADQDLDFAQFDNDGPDGVIDSGDDDGVVDAVFIVLERVPVGFLLGEATGIGELGFKEGYSSQDASKDGVPVEVRAGQGTIQQGRTFAETVGAMCHEYGHVLGLPDLYNTEFYRKPDAGPEGDSAGVGAWCLMGWGASGWHGNDGPNSFCAWSRVQLGWVTVIEVVDEQEQIALEGVGKRGVVLKVPVTNREFFLAEHRRREGNYYDRNIPGEGVLIWHIEQNNAAVGQPIHLGVDLECADGKWRDAGYPAGRQPDSEYGEDNLDFWAHDVAYAQTHGGNLGDATDPFDGVRFREFTPQTNPDSYSNDWRRSIEITGIHQEGEGMVFQVRTEPLLITVDRLYPQPLVAGQEEEVQFQLTNRGGVPAADLKAVLGTQDTLVEILQAETRFRDLGVDRNSSAGPLGSGYPKIRFRDQFFGRHEAELYLDISSGGALVNRVSFPMVAVSPRQRVQRISVIDTLGNGDGVAQAGETIRLEVGLEGDSKDAILLPKFRYRLRHLDQGVRPTRGELAALISQTKGLFIRSPEFLVSSTAKPGGMIPFELEIESDFSAWKDTFSVEVGVVAGMEAAPLRFALSTNYPNPFNPTTTLRFSLPQAGEAELSIYNLLGQCVATLVHGPQEAGPHTLVWNGRDDQGRELASGVYFYRLQAGTQVQTRKLLLLR